MRGKTNALHELHDISSIELTANEAGVVYLPADYDVTYFSKVTTVRDTSLIKAFCENLPHELTPTNTQGVVSIRSYAFRYDTGVAAIAFADTVTTLYGNAFFDSGAALADIGERCFESSSNLETVNLHGSNTIIRNYAFNSCTKLKQVTLNGVSELKSSIFNNDYRLYPIVIPACTTSVGDYAFSVNSDTNTQNNLNQGFYVKCMRIPQFATNSNSNLIVAPTKLGYAFMNNRFINSTRKVLFVPWEWYLVYHYYSNNNQAAVWSNAGVWIEAQAGETLPTTSHQVYSTYSANYAITWYSEPSMENEVTTASTAGTYYGKMEEVS